MQIGAQRKIYCNTCELVTNHELKAVSVRSTDQVEGEYPYENLVFWEKYEYCFWVCLGCDTAVFEETYDNMARSEDEPIKSKFFPDRDHELRTPLKDYRTLPPKLWAAYKEVIESYNHGLLFCCSMMLRALLEGICVNQGIPDKKPTYKLSEKLIVLKQKLEENRDLPPAVGKALDSLKDIGDRVAHGLSILSKRELEQAIEFVESLIEYVYRIEYRKTIARLNRSSESIAK